MDVVLSKALREATGRLCRAGVPSPEFDARVLAAYLLGCGPVELGLAEVSHPFITPFLTHYDALVSRRERREPLQHIVGHAPFGPLELKVGPGVFIPRPETEVLADWAVRMLKKAGAQAPVVVDLCTGTGALALYIKYYVPDADVYAVELSPAALAYTRENAAGSGVVVVEGDVTDADVLGGLHGRVDMVVTNPPYVPETPDLEPEVYHDPHMAVFSGETGMDLITQFVPTLKRLLKPGGLVGVEHDDTTSGAVQRVLADADFGDVSVLRDLAGRDRFVTARRGGVS